VFLKLELIWKPERFPGRRVLKEHVDNQMKTMDFLMPHAPKDVRGRGLVAG